MTVLMHYVTYNPRDIGTEYSGDNSAYFQSGKEMMKELVASGPLPLQTSKYVLPSTFMKQFLPFSFLQQEVNTD